MSKLMLKIILIFTSLIVVGLLVLAVESAYTDDPITVDVGTLPAGKSVTIVLEVTIDEPFPVGVLEVCNQGTVSGDNFADVLTDDPNEPGSDNQTCTTLDNVGQIIIVKDANLEDDTEFNFDGGSLGAFTLKDPSDDTETFADQAPGTYVFTETVPADWDLDNITCLTNDQNDTTVTDTINSRVTIDLDAHEIITCTFSNAAQTGIIVIEKQTDPAGGTGFQFTNDIPGGPTPFNLDDGGNQTFNGVFPGTYTVTETDPTPGGYDLTSLNCVETGANNSVGAVGTRTAAIELEAGETITCTFANVADDDDGVPAVVEDGAPNGGDGNNDGIPDSQQGNVASLPNAVDGRYVTLVSPPGTNLAGVRAVDTPADAPAGVAFPVGLFQFTVQGLAPGGAAVVTMLLPAGVTVDTYYKRGPKPPGAAVQWYEFLFDGTTGAQFLAGQVALSFVDGQRGDDLAGLDSQVVDQGGPGRLQFTLTVGTVGGGTGRVTSDPAGIYCGDDCQESYAENTVVTLTAHPGVKSYLASWSGDCSGTGLTAQVTMDADKICTATFGYPIGGIVVPVDKLGLVAPWLAALVALVALGVVLVRRRRS